MIHPQNSESVYSVVVETSTGRVAKRGCNLNMPPNGFTAHNIAADPNLLSFRAAIDSHTLTRTDGESVGLRSPSNQVYDPANMVISDAPQASIDAWDNADKETEVRAERDRLLNETNGSQDSDNPGRGNPAMLQYRQDLRDVPQQGGFPNTINWPVRP